MTRHDLTVFRSAEDCGSDDPDGASAPPTVGFDAASYRSHLAGLDLTDEQADELLRILWDMLRQLVHLDVPSESWGQIIGTVTGHFDAAATGVDS